LLWNSVKWNASPLATYQLDSISPCFPSRKSVHPLASTLFPLCYNKISKTFVVSMCRGRAIKATLDYLNKIRTRCSNFRPEPHLTIIYKSETLCRREWNNFCAGHKCLLSAGQLNVSLDVRLNTRRRQSPTEKPSIAESNASVFIYLSAARAERRTNKLSVSLKKHCHKCKL
jgi:hypothetical protein